MRGLLPAGVVSSVVCLVVAAAAGGRGGAAAYVSVASRPLPLPARRAAPPVCKPHQQSTRKRPCRKHGAPVGSAGVPDAGWELVLSLDESADASWRLRLSLSRVTGSVTERHTYLFTLSSGSVAVAPDLSTLTVDTGAQLGPFGSAKLALRAPGAASAGPPPGGCSGGTWTARSGTLAGTLAFAADASYFRTLRETSVPVTLTGDTGGTASCGGSTTPPCVHTTGISVSAAPPATSVNVGAAGAGQPVTITAFGVEHAGPASIGHQLIETGLPAADLSVAPDLSGGSVGTTGSTRFTGALAFTATAPSRTSPSPACGGTFSIRQGTNTGGLVAHYRAIRPPTIAGGPTYAFSQ